MTEEVEFITSTIKKLENKTSSPLNSSSDEEESSSEKPVSKEQSIVRHQLLKKSFRARKTELSRYKSVSWTPEDDQKLAKLIKDGLDWDEIAEQFADNRTPLSCQKRWLNYIKSGSAEAVSTWACTEDETLVELKLNGLSWYDIALQIPGRSIYSCRSRWDRIRNNRTDVNVPIELQERWSKVLRRCIYKKRKSSLHKIDDKYDKCSTVSNEGGSSGSDRGTKVVNVLEKSQKQSFTTSKQETVEEKKKGIRFSHEEDELLCELKSAKIGWIEIAENLPGRNIHSCKQRWSRIRNSYSKESNSNNKKNDDQCSTITNDSEEVAVELDDESEQAKYIFVNSKSTWSNSEMSLLRKLRNKDLSFKEIAEKLPGRSSRSCRDKWNRLGPVCKNNNTSSNKDALSCELNGTGPVYSETANKLLGELAGRQWQDFSRCNNAEDHRSDIKRKATTQNEIAPTDNNISNVFRKKLKTSESMPTKDELLCDSTNGSRQWNEIPANLVNELNYSNRPATVTGNGILQYNIKQEEALGEVVPTIDKIDVFLTSFIDEARSLEDIINNMLAIKRYLKLKEVQKGRA